MSHLHFHILDTQSKDRKADDDTLEYVIHLFGTTATGQSVRVDVEGFRPTLYIRLPTVSTVAAVDLLHTYLTTQGILLSTLTLRRIYRKTLYGFTAKTLFPFLEITCPSLATWRKVKALFLTDQGVPKTKRSLGSPFPKGTYPEVYEANFDPMLRFFHVQGLNPCGWVQVDDGLDRIEDAKATTWVLTASFDDLRPTTSPGSNPSAPFVLASWDIECYSHSGDFPVADKPPPDVSADQVLAEFDAGRLGQLRPGKTRAQLVRDPVSYPKCVDMGDPVIQIGVTLALEKHLFVWPDCTAIDGLHLHVYETEAAMILGWFKWLVEVNPDILIGYNIFGFDERYLWARAEVLGLVGALSPIHSLNRLGDPVKCEEKRLSSSALGDNFMYIWSMAGRLQIDLYHYIKRSASLPSYKLDEVAKHYLSGSLKGYEKGTAGDGSLVLTLGGAVKDLRPGRALCLLDETGESMTDKMVIRSVEGARVTVGEVRGEDGEVLDEAELAFATKWVIVKDDISPADIFRLHRGSAADRALVGKYCLQDCDLVLELYKKLEVFNNSMSMANVCCVPISYIFVRGQGIKAESLVFRACREGNTLIPVLPSPSGEATEEDDSYEGAIVLDPVPGFYSKAPIGVADFASLYPSTIESENISHDSLVWSKDYGLDGTLMSGSSTAGPSPYESLSDYGYTDISFDLLRPDPEDKRKHPVKVKVGTRVCRYAQPLDGSKSMLPTIIRSLLAARKAKRKEAAAEPDPGRKALLDAEQLAYKLTANSLYGQLGSRTFKVRLQDLAASVTAYGRKQILFAKEVIETFYGPEAGDPRCKAKVVYGDTDSLFIEFDVSPLTGREARKAVIDLTGEAGKLVTQVLKPPHDFEFDKVFDPMLMLSKKRYAGLMYEENADDFVFKYMGIALKRRDNAPIVKTIFGTAMRTLLLEKDVPKAALGVQQACLDLVHGKVKLGQLTITKSLRAEYADATRIAHKVLADRMMARDPGSAPASGDRIPYVYIQAPVGSAAAKLQGERIESPAWIKAHGLTPDYEFYLHHQLQNPICQMFGLLLDQIPGSDTIPWASAPPEEEKRLAWQEAQAAQLLFRAAYQACSKGQTKAFVNKFFGASVVIGPQGATLKTTKTTIAATATTATTQTSLNQFMLDGFLVKTIEKAKRATRKAKEEAKAGEAKAGEAKAGEAKAPAPKQAKPKPKNEILLPK